MLNEQEVKDKLHDYADQFRLRCQRREWAAAKMLYFRAQTVATFLEFPEAELARLFGNRAYKEEWEQLKDGLFPERDVERAGWECVRMHKTYDDLHLRPLQRYGPIAATGTPDYWWDGTGLQVLETDKVEIESMTYDGTMEILNATAEGVA